MAVAFAVGLAVVGPSIAAGQSSQTTTETPSKPGEAPSDAPDRRPGERPLDQQAPTPPERPFIDRPATPTERVLPAPAVTPRPTDVPPAPPGPTIPSVAAPPVVASPAALGVVPTAVFEVHPSIGLSEEYSDNFLQRNEDRQSNFRTTLTPGFTLLINSPLTKGVIAYSFGLAHDSSASGDFGHFHSLLGSVTWEATPLLSLTLSDAFTRSDEPSQADRLSLRRERSTFVSNRFAAEATYRLRGLSVRPYYSNSIFSDQEETGQETVSHTLGTMVTVPLYTTNSLTGGYEYLRSTTSDTSDVTGHRLTAAVSRLLNPRTTVGLAAGLTMRDESEEAGQGDRFKIWNLSLFASRTLTGRLTLDTSLGVSMLTTDEGNRGDFGPSLSTASTLAYRFGRITAILGVDKGFSETFESGENFGVVDTEGVTGRFSYAFSPALSTSLGAFYRKNDFTGVAGGAEDGTETSWGANASVALRLRSWLDVGLLYSYTDRRDDRSEADTFTENRIQAFLRAAF